MSFYLKYRPQKTSQLDIGVVREFYADLLSSGKLSHAYLFSGPRGTGKTSSARILAKVVNCEQNRDAISKGKPLSEPCGECGICERITKGSSLSVVEMDAASNRGIDDIRLLKERIALAPAESSYVVYIIDEVHMLTTEAFNALLKTLEEPPAHAIFALCTTEHHKLPETILSRCVQIIYPKATPEEVMGSLKKAVAGEGLVISDKALLTLASSVDGSFRDGMKILEQLSQKGATISDDAVNHITHRTKAYDVLLFVDALVVGNAPLCLKTLRELEHIGADFSVYAQRVLEDLRRRLHECMLAGEEVNLKRVITLIEMTSQAILDIKTAYISVLPLEVLAVEASLPVDKKTLTPPAQEKISREKPFLQPIQEKKIATSKSQFSAKLHDIEAKWDAILAGVKPLNHSLEALLRSSRPVSIADGILTIEVFYAFHRDKLDEEKNKVAIEKVVETIFGHQLRLSFVLKNSQKPKSGSVASSTKNETDLVSAAEEIFS